VSRWRTNYCGAFTMAGLYVNTVVGDVTGEYILSMFIDTFDPALLIGREDFGEPKKIAKVGLFREGNEFVGTVDRMGERLVDLRLTAGDDIGPSTKNSVTLSAKAQLALGGGLDGDAQLLATYGVTNVWVDRPGTGTLTLGGTTHDPLNEFPVREVVSAGYVESELLGGRPDSNGEYLLGTVPAEQFLPYHYGRLDDWSAHDALLGNWTPHNTQP
jgi:acetoacetate decarboxylase